MRGSEARGLGSNQWHTTIWISQLDQLIISQQIKETEDETIRGIESKRRCRSWDV